MNFCSSTAGCKLIGTRTYILYTRRHFTSNTLTSQPYTRSTHTYTYIMYIYIYECVDYVGLGLDGA